MAHMIEINDSCDGLLSATLPMILNEIGEQGSNLHWSFLYLYATGDLGELGSMPDLEEKISNSPVGFCIDWQGLNEVSVKFDQMFDTLIVGSSSRDSIKKYKDDEELYSNYKIVLDLFDGAYWRVYCEDESIIDKLSARFSDVKLSR